MPFASRYAPSTGHASPILRVPDDVRDRLFDLVDGKTLQSLRFTSGAADELVARYWQDRVDRLLSRFVSNRSALLDFLDRCRAVISGSSALALIYRETWTPSDLDLYAPLDTAGFLVYYLVQHEGYLVQTPSDDEQYATYGDPGTIFRVHRLRRGSSSIDIIQSRLPSALYPIASFWATHLINYISARGFISGYYDLTFARRALINPDRLADFTTPTPRISALIQKYEGRGYDMRLDNAAWDRDTNVNATCPGGGSSGCATTVRYLGDGHCFMGSLRAVRTVTPSAHLFRGVSTRVAWIRGGWTCGGMCSMTDWFISPQVFPHRVGVLGI